MAKIHDLFVVELAEVIKGYGNNPDIEDPFRVSEFYRFYELPNIAVSRENFEKMRPIEPQRMSGKWIPQGWNDTYCKCSCCDAVYVTAEIPYSFCPNCGAYMRGGQDE